MFFSFKVKISSFHARTANLALLNIIYLIKKKIKKIKIHLFNKLTTKNRLITVLKGPQINKKARNQFILNKFNWFFSLSFKLIDNLRLQKLINLFFYFFIFKQITFSYSSKSIKKNISFKN